MIVLYYERAFSVWRFGAYHTVRLSGIMACLLSSQYYRSCERSGRVAVSASYMKHVHPNSYSRRKTKDSTNLTFKEMFSLIWQSLELRTHDTCLL
jgi:hypothetical protein